MILPSHFPGIIFQGVRRGNHFTGHGRSQISHFGDDGSTPFGYTHNLPGIQALAVNSGGFLRHGAHQVHVRIRHGAFHVKDPRLDASFGVPLFAFLVHIDPFHKKPIVVPQHLQDFSLRLIVLVPFVDVRDRVAFDNVPRFDFRNLSQFGNFLRMFAARVHDFSQSLTRRHGQITHATGSDRENVRHACAIGGIRAFVGTFKANWTAWRGVLLVVTGAEVAVSSILLRYLEDSLTAVEPGVITVHCTVCTASVGVRE